MHGKYPTMSEAAMTLFASGTVEQLLLSVNFLSPAQEMALVYCLEGTTVQDLLDMPTAQTLADIIQEKAYELYAKEQKALPKKKQDRGSLTYKFNNAQIEHCDIGELAYKLLRYVHRMFDPIQGAVHGVHLV